MCASGASFCRSVPRFAWPAEGLTEVSFCSCDELKEQNATLAAHLEAASASATQLQARHTAVSDGAAAAGEGTGADADTIEAITASHNASVEQLREVIRYLRREKDIIDLQLEFSKQEATRLKQQLDFTSRSLEEARQALQEVRTESHRQSSSFGHC